MLGIKPSPFTFNRLQGFLNTRCVHFDGVLRIAIGWRHEGQQGANFLFHGTEVKIFHYA